MDFIFWLAIVNNIFSIFGFAGVLNHQKELVTGFFAYNAVQMIVSFHYFVDVCADVRIRYAQPSLLCAMCSCMLAAGHNRIEQLRIPLLESCLEPCCKYP